MYRAEGTFRTLSVCSLKDMISRLSWQKDGFSRHTSLGSVRRQAADPGASRWAACGNKATNIILNGAGVVGVYGIAVISPVRGKGIGAAITLKPILEARDRQGYDYSVLFSPEMGTSVPDLILFMLIYERGVCSIQESILPG